VLFDKEHPWPASEAAIRRLGDPSRGVQATEGLGGAWRKAQWDKGASERESKAVGVDELGGRGE
jgi:hypothetical protein